MQIFTNHIGYPCFGNKNAVVLASSIDEKGSAKLIDADTHQVVQELSISPGNTVDNWHLGHFHQINFSEFTQAGRYYLTVGNHQSHLFEIGKNVLMNRTFSDCLHYFKSQRCGGIFDQRDHHAPLLNSTNTVDVHGGWYDASGDVSKYLSHLSYANYLNPQQTPMIVWNMLKGLELAEKIQDFAKFSAVRLTEEALFGADFLMRMLSPEGYFYTTVFDKWSKDINQREICAYETQSGHKGEDYQAGFRQGGGVAIAALARASRLVQHGEFTSNQYLEAAIKAYQHLVEHNTQYLNDGTENIIDEYCALLAAVELSHCTQEQEFANQAQIWAQRLAQRQMSDDNLQHFWAANSDGSRPYFHAAEAGLPVIALCEYAAIEKNSTSKQAIIEVINNALRFEITISSKVNNPFSYPRQYVKGVNEEKREAFFVAHNNESGYWWQGENARIASLSCMANLAQQYTNDPELRCELQRFSQSALDWIVGLNPYDMCMLDGHGHNNPDYLPELGFFNAKGGVCNGITAGFNDENDIAFNPNEQKDDMLQNWRWGEQWIPHGGWYLLAIIAQQYQIDTESTSTLADKE